ncbi:oligosaccharide flippase family protein [Bacillus sp. AGMB 02131]|uniref:Oligosaccharide flippase family protein n=1 Tax=Peribacillus faecalis TaxID=2772559 RepID=A0A927CUU5_9BACI|nr:oligosaccharide flippase family protein [Peribacillus faecalis]MBD3107142.1 oligosaccharide flippase family protein [Peribacillus faecalis]
MYADKKKNLFKNTILLYILVFSSYFFAFISVPFQTRILGPEFYGKLGFALAFMAYFRVLIDFGFILSATEEVSRKRDNIEELSKVVIAVNIIKVILTTFSFVILVLLIENIPKFQEDSLLYYLVFFSVISGAFFPDYLYRGLENMKTITIRTVLIQASFVFLLILFLKDKEQYYLVPVLTTLGNLVALVAIYIHSIKKIGIRFIKIDHRYIWKIFKRSSSFFYSRIASSVYSSTNTFILGLIYPVGSNIVGLYNATDKLVITAKSGFSPIADSLYPYMVKNRDFRLVRKILYIIMPPVIIGSLIVGIYAEELMGFILGEDFRSAGNILRMLIPIVAMTPIIYILGFPVLTPMGLSKHANLSIIIGSLFHIIGLAVLLFTENFSVITICYLTILTELIILIYRVVLIRKKRFLL